MHKKPKAPRGSLNLGVSRILPSGKQNPEYRHRHWVLNKEDYRIQSRDAFRRKQGLDVEEAERIWSSLNQCQICDAPISGKGKHLDHNHKTKVIRGVLCSKCNQALGLFQEDPELMSRAVTYLRKTNGGGPYA